MSWKPMLADRIDAANVNRMVSNDHWWAEQKLDGHRVLMYVENGVPSPLNRNGEEFKGVMDRAILRDFNGPQWKNVWILDGEMLDGKYYLFDLLMVGGNETTNSEYRERRHYLDMLFEKWVPQRCELTQIAKISREKIELIDNVKRLNGEGIMWKHVLGRYQLGKRSRDVLKWKFTETADVIVSQIWRSGKRSVGLVLFDAAGENLVEVGACTMSEHNLERIKVGDVVEVRYLYVGAGGKLFQPAFLRVRNDKKPIDCRVDQLKHVNKEIVKT